MSGFDEFESLRNAGYNPESFFADAKTGYGEITLRNPEDEEDLKCVSLNPAEVRRVGTYIGQEPDEM